jgi:hypothetical protein
VEEVLSHQEYIELLAELEQHLDTLGNEISDLDEEQMVMDYVCFLKKCV